MTAQTPTVAEQKDVLLFLSDPHRREELLKLIGDAETAQARAAAMKAEADAAHKLAADELTKAREVQDINTKKSGALRDQTAQLAEQAEALKAAKADDVAHLAAWEQRNKERGAELDARAEKLAADISAHAERVNEFANELSAAQAIIDRAERIKAAAES